MSTSSQLLTNPTNSNVYPFSSTQNPASSNPRALHEPLNKVMAAKGLIGGKKRRKISRIRISTG